VNQQRLTRYLTAPRNEKPGKIPICAFVTELTAIFNEAG